MFKKNNEWLFASYIWNDTQTEAFYSNAGGLKNVTFVENGLNRTIDYHIPNASNCATCHTLNDIISPLGIKPQNLNFSISYNDDSSKNQLQKWEEIGYLQSGYSNNINAVVNFRDASQNLDMRVRSYFDSQCAHCHNVGGNARSVTELRYTFSETENNPVNMGVCVPLYTTIPGISRGRIIYPQNSSQSGLFYAINTNNSFYRMPRIGRTVIDQEAVTLVEQWINSLPVCN